MSGRVGGGTMGAWWRLSGRVGLGLLIGTVVLGAVPATRDHVVVVGDAVLGSNAGPPLLFAGAVVVGVLRAASLVLPRVRQAATLENDARVPSCARRTLVGLVAVAALGLAALTGSYDLGSRAYILSPVSPSGCRVIVEESAFLMAGRGEVNLLRPGAFLAHPVGTYVTDDGYRPVESGSYTLTWTNREGHLDVAASPGASVQTLQGGGRVTCSA